MGDELVKQARLALAADNRDVFAMAANRLIPAMIDRIEALQGALTDLLMAFDEHVAIPDRNCSCHLSPPCGDCVTWSFARDAFKTARRVTGN